MKTAAAIPSKTDGGDLVSLFGMPTGFLIDEDGTPRGRREILEGLDADERAAKHLKRALR